MLSKEARNDIKEELMGTVSWAKAMDGSKKEVIEIINEIE